MISMLGVSHLRAVNLPVMGDRPADTRFEAQVGTILDATPNPVSAGQLADTRPQVSNGLHRSRHPPRINKDDQQYLLVIGARPKGLEPLTFLIRNIGCRPMLALSVRRVGRKYQQVLALQSQSTRPRRS